MKFDKILKSKTVQNAGWIISGRLFNKMLSFLVGLLAVRYLGPSNYGLINYAAAYNTFFVSLCHLGINSVIIKNFTDHPQEEGQTLGTSLLLQASSSFLSAVMITSLVSIVDADEPATILVVALSSLGLVFQVFDTMKQWFQSKLKSKYAAIATMISYTVVSAYKLILLMTGKSVEWFAIATSLEYIVAAVCLLIAYRKQGGPKFSVSAKKAGQLLMAGKGFIATELMMSIYASTDRLMLKQMLDEAAVGYYSVAVSLSTIWTFVLHAIIDSVHPSIIQAYGQDRRLFQRKNRQLYALVIYMAGCVSLLIHLLAEPLVQLLYGVSYLPAAQPLKIVVCYTAFSYLGVARTAWVVCENKQDYLKYLYIGAAVINVILNLLLIPTMGASGAAWASLAAQISTVALSAVIPPLRPNIKLMWDALLLKDLREEVNK